MRWFLGSIVALTLACDPDSGGAGDLESCELAEDSQTCPECSEGPATCTFGDLSETANSCAHCQAKAALYQSLCDAGEAASREEIEADTVCVSAETEN